MYFPPPPQGNIPPPAKPGFAPSGPPPYPPYMEAYGSRMMEYKYLGYIGLLMVLLGPGFLLPVFLPWGIVAGISLLFIGGMCAISGLMGYYDEKKKLGRPRISTTVGWIGASFGVISVLSGSTPIIPIFLGVIGIVLGRMAYKKGDLEFGEVGMYCGAAGIVVDIILMCVFWLF